MQGGGKKQGKGRFVALRLSSSRLVVVVSSRRLVVSSRRLVFVSSRRLVFVSSRRLAFVSPEGRKGGEGKKGGTQDKLNQKGSNRPLEDALKSNEGVKL